MNSGIMSERRTATSTSVFAIVAAGAAAALVSLASAASATEPASGTARFSDSVLLDAARSAAAKTTASTGTVNIGVPPADELRVLEARRDAELKRLSEKLKRAAEQHGRQPTEIVIAPWATEVATAPVDDKSAEQRSGLGARPSDTAEFVSRSGGFATILMVMTPSDSRARDAERATDPILCVTAGCFVSNGAQAPATYHSFNESLSLGGRLGRGAGECNRSSVCVFRNVELGVTTAMVQPINLRFVRHDRREQSQVTIDESCRVIDNRLSCSRPVRTSSYTLWVVPENIARSVGPEMLTAAVSGGLRTAQTAELPWIRQ